MRQIECDSSESRGPQPPPAEARYSHPLIHAVPAGRGPRRYFSVGQIDAEQLRDYAERRGLAVETVEKIIPNNV